MKMTDIFEIWADNQSNWEYITENPREIRPQINSKLEYKHKFMFLYNTYIILNNL